MSSLLNTLGLSKRVRIPPGLLGGEWGGWLCTFDAATGAVRPIPDKFMSEEAIAWGQVQMGFEELQTESWGPIPQMDGSEAPEADEPGPESSEPSPLRSGCA